MHWAFTIKITTLLYMSIKKLFKTLFLDKGIDIPIYPKKANIGLFVGLSKDLEDTFKGRLGYFEYKRIKDNLKNTSHLKNPYRVALKKLQELDSNITADYLKANIDEIIKFLKEKEYDLISQEEKRYKDKREKLEEKKKETEDTIRVLEEKLKLAKETIKITDEHLIVITEHTLIKREEIKNTISVVRDSLEKEKKNLE